MRHHLISSARSFLPQALAGALFAASCIGASQRIQTQDPQWTASLPSFQVRRDEAGERSWVLHHDAVHVYDDRRKRLIQRVELAGWLLLSEAFGCPPELLLTTGGAALVTSNVVPTIWEIEPASFAVRQHRLDVDADDQKDFGFTALAYNRTGRNLLGVSSMDGSVWTIDLETDRARKTQLPRPAPGTCGSLPWAASGPM